MSLKNYIYLTPGGTPPRVDSRSQSECYGYACNLPVDSKLRYQIEHYKDNLYPKDDTKNNEKRFE